MTRVPYIKWHDWRVKRLAKMVGQKLQYWQIASRMGLTEQQVAGAIVRYGLQRKVTGEKWSGTEDSLLLRHRGKGVQFDQIAAMLPGRNAPACVARHHRLKAKKNA